MPGLSILTITCRLIFIYFGVKRWDGFLVNLGEAFVIVRGRWGWCIVESAGVALLGAGGVQVPHQQYFKLPLDTPNAQDAMDAQDGIGLSGRLVACHDAADTLTKAPDATECLDTTAPCLDTIRDV